MASSPCPEDPELLALVMGSTVPEAVRRHVDDCAACRLRVDRLRAELSAVRQVADELPVPERRCERRLRGDGELPRRPRSPPEDDLEDPEPGDVAAAAREHRPIPDRRRARFGRPGGGLPRRAPDPAARPGDQDRPRARRDRPQPPERTTRRSSASWTIPTWCASTTWTSTTAARSSRWSSCGAATPRRSRSSRGHPPTRRRRGSRRSRGRSPTCTAAGVVHQDIKPRNIMLDESGRPRLIDFGMARWRTRLVGPLGPVRPAGRWRSWPRSRPAARPSGWDRPATSSVWAACSISC